MESLYAWIHVADLALGRAADAERPIVPFVRKQLRLDIIKQLPELGVAPEAIVVTGDVGGAGQATDYAEARTFLVGLAGAAGLGAERVLVVPGARDLTPPRAEDRSKLARLLESLRAGEETLDSALADADDRACLRSRREHYHAFVESLGNASTTAGDTGLDWTHSTASRSGLTVHFIGLDTAIVATGDDRGKLRVSLGALTSALPAPPEDLVIVLSQHALDDGWLTQDDDASNVVGAHAHVHLSGRRDGSSSLRKSARRVLHSAAGGKLAVDGAEQFTYSLMAVLAAADGALCLRVWPRRYVQKQLAFRRDSESLSSDLSYDDFPLALQRDPSVDGPPQVAALLENIALRTRVLESRIAAVASVKLPTREALRGLEAEIQRYLGGVGDDLRTLQTLGVEPSNDMRAGMRTMRRSAQPVLARGMLRTLAKESSPPPDTVFRWSSLLVDLGTHDDVALLEDTWQRLRFDFLKVHALNLAERLAPPR
jgi:hypothetical protein